MTDKNDPTWFREQLLEKRSCIELGLLYAEMHIQETAGEDKDQDYVKEARSTLKNVVFDSIETIFAYSQSEIEKIFLCSFYMHCILNDPTLAFIYSPLHSVKKELADFHKRHKAVEEVYKIFVENHKTQDINEFITFVDNYSRASEETKRSVSTHAWNYLETFLYESFHIHLQSNIKEIKVEGHSIRPDIFVWNPSLPRFKLVVECDGFDYHAGKKEYTRDRIRDRLLLDNGYQFLRFSGSEIYNDPVGVGREFTEYLLKRRPKRQAKQAI